MRRLRSLAPLMIITWLFTLLLAGPAAASGPGGGSGGGSSGGGGNTPPPTVPVIQLSPDTLVMNSGVSEFCQYLIQASGTAPAAVATISASNAAITVPGTINVPPGGTGGMFQYTANAVTVTTSTTITVRLGTNSASFTVTVSPAVAATLSAISVFPSTIASKDVVNLRPALTSSVPPGGVTVALSSSNPTLLPVPASLFLPAGFSQTSVDAQAGTATVTTVVTVTATLAGKSVSSPVTVQPTRVPTSIGFATPTVNDSAPSSAVVSISVPDDSLDSPAFTVALSSSNPAVAAVPASVGFPSQEAGTSFGIALGKVTAPTPVTITATANGVSVSGVLTVVPTPPPPPPPFALQALSVAPDHLNGAGTATGTVTATTAAPAGGITVKLSSSDTKGATVPATVVIPAGATSATFPVTASGQANTTVAIGALYQNTGPAGLFGAFGAKGGAALFAVAGQILAPDQVNVSDGNGPEIFGGGPKAVIESGQLPPGASIVSIQHNDFVLLGTPRVAGTYTFVMAFAGANGPSTSAMPLVWVITP